MIGTSEAMNLGQNLGLDPKLLAEVINKSTGRCWSSELYNPCPGVLENVPSSKNYQGGFGTALMAKVKKYCPVCLDHWLRQISTKIITVTNSQKKVKHSQGTFIFLRYITN